MDSVFTMGPSYEPTMRREGAKQCQVGAHGRMREEEKEEPCSIFFHSGSSLLAWLGFEPCRAGSFWVSGLFWRRGWPRGSPWALETP